MYIEKNRKTNNKANNINEGNGKYEKDKNHLHNGTEHRKQRNNETACFKRNGHCKI